MFLILMFLLIILCLVFVIFSNSPYIFAQYHCPHDKRDLNALYKKCEKCQYKYECDFDE